MSAERLLRWRLVLGESPALADTELDADARAVDAALAWLYDRDPDLAARGERRPGADTHRLDVPGWLDEVHRLFPRETIERLERAAVERYGIHELVTSPDVLRRATPSPALLRAVLRTKHLMNAEVLALARELVARVVRELVAALATTTRRAAHGSRRRRRSTARLARSFDAARTVRANLGRWRPTERRLGIDRPLFFSRTRPFFERGQVILLVDESQSMVGSVIHAAVTAACLWNLPGVQTHLAIFDTEVVDLTAEVHDPVEILMRVQLGGGTDIARAMEHAASLVTAPRRAIVVLVSDLYEGGDAAALVARVRALVAQGTTVLALAALDEEARPAYDRELGQRLADAGAHVGAMTPGELVGFLTERLRP